jgi:ATP-binding cassette subfamily B protein
VLHDVSFQVAPGDRIALVGHTGAGKSSIAKLLSRMYDPEAGSVRVDGQDLRGLDLASFRRRLGVVPQDAFLFRGTIASNIAYAKPDATREEIEQAARDAGVHDVLAGIRDGFDARVEEEARNLTAGERQLIAIARAVLADPDILVLDEATASLDAATEAKVVDALFALERTTILVTHRAPLAERADMVIVLADGRIVDAGTHRELLANQGMYASMWAYAAPTSPGQAAARRTRRRAAEAKAERAPARKPAKKAAKGKKKAAAAIKRAATAKRAASGSSNGRKDAKSTGKAGATKETPSRAPSRTTPPESTEAPE